MFVKSVFLYESYFFDIQSDGLQGEQLAENYAGQFEVPDVEDEPGEDPERVGVDQPHDDVHRN